MIDAFRYLILKEAANRLRRQAQRLRSPRYALALVVGLLYFWFIFGGSDAFSGEPREPSPLPGLIRAVGPLLLAFYAAAAWIFGKADALAFRPAEVHLLFAGPLTRRDLLRYKLLHAQVPLLFTSTFVTLATYGAALPWWLRFPSVWVLFATLQLHQMAAALVHEAARQQGLIGWRRNWLPITVFGAAAGALVISLMPAYNAARAAPDFAAGRAILGEALRGPVPGVVLAPFRWVLAPLFGGPGEWPVAIAIAAAVLLLHYLWVLRTDTAFEESAAAAGERHALAAHALRTGGGWRSYARALRPEGEKRKAAAPAAFQLAPAGLPETALVWKNLTLARRSMSRSTPVLVLVAAVVLTVMFRAGGATEGEALEQVATIALIFGGVLVVVGPLWVRNDLRTDLLRLDVLRTLPLEPGRLVAAEIAASAITASLASLALLALGAALLWFSGELPLPRGYFLLACFGSLLVVPAVITLGVTVQCTIALAFPAWVHLGRSRPGGIEAMGQNILTLAASMVLIALLLLPPALTGALMAAFLWGQWGPLAPALGGLAAIAMAYAEVVLAAGALGRLFDRTDPAAAGITG
jgi:hypothetical protein